ncbi:MAG: glycine--tRNA ligase subunit beta [Rickettsiales bacterium]
MADLLLELFCEEIPARMQAAALSHMQKTLSGKLGKSAEGFVTPRRVAIIIKDLPAKQPDISDELKGPKVGAPEQAINGFLKKTGLTLEQLEDRSGVYFAKIEKKGEPTAELIKSAVEEMLAGFPWPKSMRWSDGDTAWVRPLHSILCIFDGAVVPVEFAGLTASNTTHGHRFLAPDKITVTSADTYAPALEKAFVIADREARKTAIAKQAQEVAAKNGLVLRKDEGLLEEVTGLVEWPVVLAGKIDKGFMDLPPEVLVSEMRAHQKYFALENDDGSFADTFLITANITASDDGKAIIHGNERVLRARLADGRFFWDQDKKKKLEDWAKGLESVTFHAKLGTTADKVARVEKLADQLVLHIESSLRGANATKQSSSGSPRFARDDVAQAAHLCKADLVTGMVGEFPELQGVMGRYYALEQGEPKEVADAIRDHYLPLGPSSDIPTQPVSICVALADKLDTLISMFAIDEKPTGSKDPFALRRAALGIIRIILENEIRLPLKTFMNDELLEFFHDRLIVQLKDSGIRHDVIKAVVADGDDDLVRIVNRAKALQEFITTENGANLLAGYKRAANIVAIEEKKDKTSHSGTVDSKLLSEAPESALAKALEANSSKIESLFKGEDFAGMMGLLAELREPVDTFFDKIMVNDDNADIRINRLRLLASIRDTMNRVADFSKIEGDSKEHKKAA